MRYISCLQTITWRSDPTEDRVKKEVKYKELERQKEERRISKSRNGPRCKKTCLRGFANNTGSDQPVHPRSLISTFVIRFLESIIRNIATGEISIF